MAKLQTAYLWLLTLFSVASVCALYVHFNPPPGMVVKKYFFPAHVKVWGHPEDGEGLTSWTPGAHVYMVRPVFKQIPDQFILQVFNGKQEGFIRVPFETWVSNTPGKPFEGYVFPNAEVSW